MSWFALPFVLYAVTEPGREADIAARQVKVGLAVAPVRVLGLTVMEFRADSADVEVNGKPGTSRTADALAARTDLVYLGRTEGAVVLFDPARDQPIQVPANAVIIRLQRPPARNGRSPICVLTSTVREWVGETVRGANAKVAASLLMSMRGSRSWQARAYLVGQEQSTETRFYRKQNDRSLSGLYFDSSALECAPSFLARNNSATIAIVNIATIAVVQFATVPARIDLLNFGYGDSVAQSTMRRQAFRYSNRPFGVTLLPSGLPLERTSMAQVVCYARVSTGEQRDSGLGLAAQRTRLESECTYRGWSDVVYLEDGGYSAKSLHRPAMQEALRMLASGEASTLVACKLDRLSRSVADFVSLLALAERQGWSLVVLDIGLDLTTPNGKFVASVMSSVAELERNLISERTRQALAVKRAQGAKLGRPRNLPAEVRAFIIRASGQGYSLTSIAQTLNSQAIPTAQGGKKWHPSTIRAIIGQLA
jgi:DNA invertase Pin-like site-specific DNA recombinase